MQAQLKPLRPGELRFAAAESQNPILSRAVSECVQVCCQAAFPLPPHCRDAANCAFQMSCRFPPVAISKVLPAAPASVGSPRGKPTWQWR